MLYMISLCSLFVLGYIIGRFNRYIHPVDKKENR